MSNKVADDLQARLDALTEKKEPGVTNTTEIPVNPWWESSDDDFEKEGPETPAPEVKKEEPEDDPEPDDEEEEEPEDDPESEYEKGKAEVNPKLTDRVKRGSAITVAGMMQVTIKMIAIPLINHNYKKKFLPNEINELDRVAEARIKDLVADEDLILRQKFEKLMNKRDRKMGKVTFTKERKDELIESMYNYFDYTQTSLTPVWYCVFAMINCVGGTVIDIIQE
jgi:hypothetical protein